LRLDVVNKIIMRHTGGRRAVASAFASRVKMLHFFMFFGSLSGQNGLLFLLALATATLAQSRREALAQ